MESGQMMRRAAYASVGVAFFLVLLKIVAWFVTGSVAMLASLADSGLDFLTSSINLYAIAQSLTPADREHRFGHGKAEPLAGLAQSAFIAGSATFLVFEAVSRLLHPQPVENSVVGVGVMLISIAGTAGLVIYQRRVVRLTGSVAVAADRLHYLSDLLANVGVIAGVVLGSIGFAIADPVIALLVAGMLVGSAWAVFRQSLDQLMDRELPDEDRERIKTIVRSNIAVRDMHELKTRKSGLSTFIQLHIELDPSISLAAAHGVSDQVEQAIKASFPGAEVIIHQDPLGAT
jgi:ferrous-iron efflux pump FieF